MSHWKCIKTVPIEAETFKVGRTYFYDYKQDTFFDGKGNARLYSPVEMNEMSDYPNFELIEQKVINDELNELCGINQVDRGDGTKANYYLLPEDATELKHLIKHKRMEHGVGEAFCALYRLNDTGDVIRNLNKAIVYLQEELEWHKSKSETKT